MSSKQTTENFNAGGQDELSRRYRLTQIVIYAEFFFILLLLALVYTGMLPVRATGTESPDTSFVMFLWIAILVCGIGAVFLRRMLFTPLRLKDIAALRGESGLLASLQNASIIMAALGGAVGIMGFLIWFSTGNRSYMLRAALVAVAILVYAFPRRSAWQRALDAARQKETFESNEQNEPAVKGFDV